MSIEELYKKRRQIRAAWDQENLPSRELIFDLLKKSMDITPSKQNLFPYKIHAYGPENCKEKETIAKICSLFKEGSVNHFDENNQRTIRSYGCSINLNDYVIDDKGNDLRDPPWVLVFEQRLAKPNNFVKGHSMLHNDWTRFTQVDENRFREQANVKLTCIEVGMFAQTLAGICLENNLGISYIRSFPEWQWKKDHYNKDKNKNGEDWSALPDITEAPLLVCQIGYVSKIEDFLASNTQDRSEIRWENKPDISEIVKFKDQG